MHCYYLRNNQFCKDRLCYLSTHLAMRNRIRALYDFSQPAHPLSLCILIPYTPDAVEVPWVAAVLLKIFAVAEYKIIYGACGGVHIIAPHYLQYLVARYHFALVLH